MFETSKDAKQAGWYSRRHQTNEAMLEHRYSRLDRVKDRRNGALERAEARAQRSDAEQLEILRQRGVTEGREVERLLKRMASPPTTPDTNEE